MKKGNILFLTLLILTILAFPYQATFSEPSIDHRIPKEIIKIPLPKLLDFGMGKCIPCKRMLPILQELSEEYKGRVIIKIIEVHLEPQLTRTNRVQLIPTQIFFDSKNNEVSRHVGFMDKEQIKKVFDKMGVNPVRKSSNL